jgi:hypothetical protein
MHSATHISGMNASPSTATNADSRCHSMLIIIMRIIEAGRR